MERIFFAKNLIVFMNLYLPILFGKHIQLKERSKTSKPGHDYWPHCIWQVLYTYHAGDDMQGRTVSSKRTELLSSTSSRTKEWCCKKKVNLARS